jgi:hypothetical protein
LVPVEVADPGQEDLLMQLLLVVVEAVEVEQ